MNVGQRIKARREELGLSVDDIAAVLNKDRSTIYRYESNEIEKLPTTVLAPLASVLNTTPAYLMGWKDDKEKVSTETNTLLSEKEQKLLDYFRSLNESGQKYLIQTAVIASQMYPKHPTVEIASQGHGVQKIETNTSKEKIQKAFDELD